MHTHIHTSYIDTHKHTHTYTHKHIHARSQLRNNPHDQIEKIVKTDKTTVATEEMTVTSILHTVTCM